MAEFSRDQQPLQNLLMAKVLYLSLNRLLDPMPWCVPGWRWAGAHPAAPSLPSTARQGRENVTKGWWVEIRTGGDHSPVTIMGKTDSTWGN